jgi:hypothetical protein
MDTVFYMLETPSWAYDFCYYYAFVAAIVVVMTVYSIVQLFMLPALVRKFLPLTQLTLSMVLSAIVSVVLTLMQFWICRGALKTKENFASKALEKFAANCQSGEDCTAIMGTPQPSYSECGARKKCGGYVMQNNMEPNELSGF